MNEGLQNGLASTSDLPNEGDDRLLLVRKQIVTATKTLPPRGYWKASFRPGGKRVAHQPTLEDYELAMKVCATLGLHTAGLGLMRRRGKRCTTEANSYSGSFGLTEATGTNVVEKTIEYAESLVESKVEAR
jgi:ribosomal protein S6--L-glutamate ligase